MIFFWLMGFLVYNKFIIVFIAHSSNMIIVFINHNAISHKFFIIVLFPLFMTYYIFRQLFLQLLRSGLLQK